MNDKIKNVLDKYYKQLTELAEKLAEIGVDGCQITVNCGVFQYFSNETMKHIEEAKTRQDATQKIIVDKVFGKDRTIN